MINKEKITLEDRILFTTTIGEVKRLKQDTLFHLTRGPGHKLFCKKRKQQQKERSEYDYYISDEYQPLLKYNPIRYYQQGTPSYEIKKLSLGIYTPDLCLDLHGLTLKEAKEEIKTAIAFCLRKNIDCICIISGHGKSILKKNIPKWLSQHPRIIGFHQAPQKYGGSAALLCLVNIKL